MNPCDADIFKNGHSVAMMVACRHRAEAWVQEVAKESGQRVDWHYTGGIVNVLYIGDHNKVLTAVRKLEPELKKLMVRLDGECGSCHGSTHRPGTLMDVSGPQAHGPYRAGDPLPDDVIAVDTH